LLDDLRTALVTAGAVKVGVDGLEAGAPDEIIAQLNLNA
jgi:hypothetical protein